MAFQKAVKGTILVGGGALASVLGLSQFAHYRRKQVNLAYVEAAECVSEPVNREPPSREAQLLTLQNMSEFDILVIGGGATGCGCALDAVTRDSPQPRTVVSRSISTRNSDPELSKTEAFGLPTPL